MKKILLVAANGLNKTGVPGVIMNIVRNLSNKYIFDIVLFDTKNAYYREEFESYGGNVFFVKNHSPKKNWFKSKIDYAISRTKIYYDAIKILKNDNYYAIHCFNELESVPFLKAAKKLNIEKRIIHNNQSVVFNSTYMHRLWKKHLLKKIDKYANIKISVAKHSGETIFINPFIVIHNTYKEDTFKYSETYFSDKTIRLVQVGTYSSKKNQLFSLELCAFLKNSHRNVELSFVGFEDEEGYLDTLKQKCKELVIEDNTEFLPFDSDIASIFRNKQILLLPSKKEAFPLVLLEAQACGLYCLASKSSPLECNAGGCFFLNNNVNEWADLLIKLINDNPNHNKYNMSDFSNSTFIKKIEMLYL